MTDPGSLESGLLRPELDGRRRGEESRRRRDALVGSTPWRRFVHWLKGGPKAEPLPSVLRVLEQPLVGRYGVCCSGGGIRSAAFNLGALQALQDHESQVLQRATYLAAVSGGSYIAAGLAMVAKVDGPDASDPSLVDDHAPPFGRLSPEEQYLRNRSSYMAPGALGKLRLAARVAMGVVVNLLFVGSALFVAGWVAGWVLSSRGLYHGLQTLGGQAHTAHAARLAAGLFVLALLAGLVLALFRLSDRTSNAFAAWAERLLWLSILVALVLVALPELVEWIRTPRVAAHGPTNGTTRDAVTIGGASTATLVLGVLLQLRARLSDSRLLVSAAGSGEKSAKAFLKDRVWPRVRAAVQLLAVAAVGPLLLGGFFVVSVVLGVADTGRELWPWVAFAFAFFAVMSALADVTTWSLHPFYRRRLASAFALRRIKGEDGTPIAAERDFDLLVPLSKSGVEPVPGAQKRREWPMLIVCAAANVSDPGATPPGRAVTSFTFSPKAIGGPLIGAVPTESFEHAPGLKERRRDFTLPAAVAMSGAALSPSMGKMTRWPLRFLLTLGNARLGVWVPNPRRLDAKERWPPLLRRLYWRPRPSLIVREMLGRNSADAHFLYVTDGGHYENLGLVELLRRGCLDVYCFDASGGRDVQELGDAIALARSELGVDVELDPAEVAELIPDAQTGFAKRTCAVGKLRYPGGPVGKLVYVRSVLTEDAPQDVIAYHELDPAFPHDSTGQQLYTDQRFEAYRALGERAAEAALAAYLPPVAGGS